MRTLYANGCSFTLGDELTNPPLQRFPSIIADTRNMNVINHARCGAGNVEICRKTMDYLMEYIDSGKDPKDLDVVIGWSLVSRWQYFDDGWKGITPNSVSHNRDAAYYYYGLFQSTEKDMLDFMWEVMVVESFLKKHDINYFFFKIDAGQHIMWNQTGAEIIDGFDLEKVNELYIKNIDTDRFPSLINPSETFREFALEYAGLKPDTHPDEKAHELFAEYIMDRL
mgnify:CR=1 FL=1|tara:strand:+ start:707 stop:1381 length:675 start_codon:yes stop_codon:yes gene_type:complete